MTRAFFPVALVFANPASSAQARRPNLVILLTEDQGTLDINCYGSNDFDTPHMDWLAAEGVLM